MQTKTVNISFPSQLLQRLDEEAKTEYRNRSEFLKEAVITYLQIKDNWTLIRADLAGRAKKMGIKNEDQIETMVDRFRH